MNEYETELQKLDEAAHEVLKDKRLYQLLQTCKRSHQVLRYACLDAKGAKRTCIETARAALALAELHDLGLTVKLEVQP